MRISRLAGRGIKKSEFKWGEIRCLIPDWGLVKDYRSRRITKEKYTEAYNLMLREGWAEVSSWLDSLSTEQDLTLLCHEKEGEFCHRLLVAELVKEHRPDIPLNVR